jgi:hypothetical protein
MDVLTDLFCWGFFGGFFVAFVEFNVAPTKYGDFSALLVENYLWFPSIYYFRYKLAPE